MSHKKAKKTRRVSEAPKEKRFRITAFLSGHWWQVLSGLVGILIVPLLIWYLKDCVTDKRDCVRRLRQAYVSQRAADEKFDQSLITFYGDVKSFIRYLDQDNIDLGKVQQYQAQLNSLAKIANDNCNDSKNAFYKLDASKREAETYYQFLALDYVLDISHKCAAISDIAGGRGMPDAKRLATDKTFRREWIEKQKPFEKESDDLLQTQPQNFRDYTDSMETLLKKMEARNSNLSESIWDCLSGGKRPL